MGKTLTGENSCVIVLAFGLMSQSQYRNDMKELFDNRPSENAVILRNI